MSAVSQVWLGVDLGSSGVRVEAYDDSGRVVAAARVPYPIQTGAPGTMIRDADQGWRRGFDAAARRVAGQLTGHRVMGIGLSGAFPGMCLLDEGGEPVGEAILYGDRRSASYVQRTAELVGRPVEADEMTPHLLRLQDLGTDRLSRTAMILGPAGTLGWWLTGRAAMDAQSAARLGGLVQDDGRAWDADVARMLGIRVDQLPPIRRATAVLGTVTHDAAKRAGLPQGIPVAVGATDTLSMLIGCGAHRRDAVTVSYSSTGAVLRNTRPLQEALDAPAFTSDEYPYQLLGYVLNSGSMLEHLRQNMLDGADYAELTRLAAESISTPGQVYVLPTALANGSGLGMSFDPYTVAGLTDLSSFGSIWRGGLEAFALAIRSNCSLDDEAEIFAAGGGAANAQWRQITSDVMGRAQTYFPRASACLGAAAVAAQAAGAAHSAVELAATWLEEDGPKATVPRSRALAEYDAALDVWRRLCGVAGNEPDAD